MSLGAILVIVAAILVIVALVVGYSHGPEPARYRRVWAIFGVALILICVALGVGVAPFIGT